MALQIVRYFAHVTETGPVCHNRYPFSIGDLSSPEQFMRVRMATQAGQIEPPRRCGG